jgi:hypothetical protein
MRWRGNGKWSLGTKYGRMHDTRAVETITGEVVNIDQFISVRGIYYWILRLHGKIKGMNNEKLNLV